jgi:hypothetical protein
LVCLATHGGVTIGSWQIVAIQDRKRVAEKG